jgi:DNA-binding NarL/FixJ family response regulator
MNKSDSASGERIRVLIVDDHAMVRQGLRTFLELQDTSALPIEVVGEAVNACRRWNWLKRRNPTSSR